MLKPKLLPVLLSLILLVSLVPIPARSYGPPDPLVALGQAAGGPVQVVYHARTGKVRFIGAQPGQPIQQALGNSSRTPEAAAAQFLSIYGSLFGLNDPESELNRVRYRPEAAGGAMLRYQQVYHGIPVLGGELIVNLDEHRDVLSAGGEVLSGLQVNLQPRLSAGAARQASLALVAEKYGLETEALQASEPDLWIYDPTILGGAGLRKPALVWRVEIKPVDLLPVRELVLFDAHLGKIALHFNQVDALRSREVYDNNNQVYDYLPGPNLVRAEGQGPTGLTDADRAFDYAGATYDFYANIHGRDSMDDRGMKLVSTVRYCENGYRCPYANAFWNGEQMAYGEGYTAGDDVVAHEMTHAVTQYESGLFYYMESGAINESFSDIWGEFVDQYHFEPNDNTEKLWLVGEEMPGGAARSMKDPPSIGEFPQPDKMTSPNYLCGEVDEGWVHINSGVGNKAASLMAAGGSFNGQTITGIGAFKVAKIYYEVQTRLLTSASDYQDLYTAVQYACSALVGQGITSAGDCQQVKAALDAVEMSQSPSCTVVAAPACPAGQAPQNLFFDDLEDPANPKWASQAVSGSVDEWFYPQTENYYGFDPTYATSGSYNLWGNDFWDLGDYAIGMVADVALPAGSTPYLRFNHAYAFEDYWGKVYDGGLVEFSLDGGLTWLDAGPLIQQNGYTGVIGSAWSNPLGGRFAFVGESNGYTASRLDLSALAGSSVRFRFRIGASNTSDPDRVGAAYGWFIDDIQVYTCTATPSPEPTPSPVPVPSGQLILLPVVQRNWTTAGPPSFP